MKKKIHNISWELFKNNSQKDEDFSFIFKKSKKVEISDEKLDENFKELVKLLKQWKKKINKEFNENAKKFKNFL